MQNIDAIEEQSLISFAHFTLFRKAVERKQTGTLAFITQLGFAGRISFIDGQLLAHNADVPIQLRHFFSKPIQDAHWEEAVRNSEDTVAPAIMLSATLENVTWDKCFCHNLATMLNTLPIVRIESMPLHFDDYRIEICASLLYRQSLASTDFRPANFLEGITSIDTLSIRLKVIVLAYVCGLMKSAPRTRKTIKKPRSGVGIASRIFQRIKGIKGKGT